MVSDRGLLGWILSGIGFAPSQLPEPRKINAQMTKQTYYKIEEAAINFESIAAKVTLEEQPIEDLEAEKRAILTIVRHIKGISPEETHARVIARTERMSEGVLVKIKAKLAEDKAIRMRRAKRSKEFTLKTISRTHNKDDTIQTVEGIINDFLSRIADIAGVPSRVARKHQRREEARIQLFESDRKRRQRADGTYRHELEN